ncbi:MAG TPA: fumarylacetoacetate hydrolase family protein [Geminicoccaceae bacterium]
MKLLRYGEAGHERPAILDQDGTIRSLAGEVDDISPLLFMGDGLDRLKRLDLKSLPRVEGSPRLGCPLAWVPNLICIGLNYEDHAKETNSPIPKEPIVFMKHTGCIIGPNDKVRIPRGSEQTDWEVELGVVIGKRTSYVSEASAMDSVVGYVAVNDVSERHFQANGGAGQWIKGKSPDTFGPIGPWFVTKDEIPDPQDLNLWLEVDGHRYQDGSTSTMIFDVRQLVSHLSKYMTLQTGDVISTGTPPGVGAGVKPDPVFLKPGQTMRLGIEGLGEQETKVVAFE